MRRADIVHGGLMLGALGLAYVLPFELLLLSYAVLGPAHYLTQISWLHERNYFLPHRAFALALAFVAFGAMFTADPYWFGVLVWGTLVACALLAATTRAQIAVLAAAAAVATLLLFSSDAPIGVLGVLLPTLIHVSVFTLVFMTLGAVKSRSRAQFALIGLYLGAIALILAMPPSAATVMPELAALGAYYFDDIPPALGSVLGVADLRLDTRIMGLLSFVYTYHYLNWFIKADVIRWSAIPKPRLAAIAASSAAATGLYFYDFVLGFTVLVTLSLLHVLLEFPLNSISIRQLGAAAGQGLARRVFGHA